MVQCKRVHWSWTFLVEIQFQLLYLSIIHLWNRWYSQWKVIKNMQRSFFCSISISATQLWAPQLEVTKNGNEDKRVKIFSRWNILQIKFGPFFKNKLQRSLRKRQTMPFNPVLDCHRIKSSFLPQPIISNMSWWQKTPNGGPIFFFLPIWSLD